MNHHHTTSREAVLALIESMLCGEITSEEHQQLNDLLRDDDRARLIFIEHMDLQAELLHLAGHARTVPDYALMHRPVGGATVRTVAWTLVAVTVVALMIVPSIIGYFARQPVALPAPKITPKPGPLPIVATLVADVDARWGEAMETPTLPVGTELRAGDWIELTSGAAILELRCGVRCVMSGRTLLSFDGGQNCFLDSGLATFDVPPEAIGFEVRTRGATFVDRGTQFGVSVGLMGESEVHVFRGLVDAQAESDDGTPQVVRLSRQQAARLNPQTRMLVPTRFNANTFAVPLAIAAGVARFTRNVRFVSEPLTEIVPPELTKFGHVFLCPETTTVLQSELVVHERFDFVSSGNPTPQRRLSAGTQLKSFLVHFSPGRECTVDGQITFQTPIAGLIVDSTGLVTTDPLFASRETSLEDADRPLRSIETPPDAVIASRGNVALYDRLRVSGPERKTLTFHLKGAQVDQFRVLLHAPPESSESDNAEE